MTLDTTLYDCEVELIEPMLGTVPKDKKVYSNFIASKAADAGLAEEEEATCVEDLEAKGWTSFHQDDEGPFIYDYLVKGVLKNAAQTLKQFGVLKQLNSKVTRYIFVYPRRIRLPEITEEALERPLRAQTAKGERVTVVKSDVIPAGTKLKFQIETLDCGGITRGCLETLLDYGKRCGLGQFRNGSYGRFKVLKLEEV